MVVVSGGWVKNVVSYPGCGDLIATSKMAAKAVLICRPNSHPFQERSLTLDQPVKIGRSVARARAAPNNAIFDCKVLSRNHALLWYENGKFYLQDTKSSNGTFVNNQRLSKGAEESPPREVCSGDIMQFGVDVMENARKVTHGCIVATLKLYLPDGKEAKASPSTSVVSSVGMVPLEDLYQLNQYLQEALQREQLLESKLAILQRLVETTRQASDLGWKALIDEDRLLSRVEILENQLQMYSKNFAEDKLREELRKLQEDKCQYQGTAKESLRKVLQEKLEAIQKLQDLERTLSNTEDECAHLKELCDRSQQDLQELAHKYSQQLQKAEDLTSKLQETEEQHREVCEHLEQEKQELQARLQEQLEAERALQLRMEALQADGDLTRQQLTALQSHLHTLQANNEDVDSKLDLDNIKATDSTGTQVDIILERIEPGLQENMKEVLQNTQEQIETLLYQLKKSEEELRENHTRVEELHLQLEESRCQENSSSELVRQLQEQVHSLEMELDNVQSDNSKNSQVGIPTHNNCSPNHANKLKVEITKLEELLSEARAKKRLLEQQVIQLQLELDCAKMKVKKATEDSNLFKQQLQAAQNQMCEKSESVSKLQEQMQWLETSADQVKQLQERLHDEQQRSNKHMDEAEKLRKQLMEAQQGAKQSRNETEQLKDRLKAAQVELDVKWRNGVGLELAQVRQHCESLQADNSKLRCENEHVEELKNQLEETNKELEDLRRRLSEQESPNPEVEQLESHTEDQQKINELEEELVVVKEFYAQCNEEKTQLSVDLTSLREEFGALSKQSNAVPVQYLLPMAIAMVAFSILWALLN